MLGKAQGATETGHNLAREQPKFGGTLLRVNDQNSVTIQHTNETRSGHNFVGDRCKHGHKSASTSIFKSAVWKHNSNYILEKKIT